MHRIAIVAVCSACSTAKPQQAPPPPQVDVVTLAQGPVVDATEYLATLRSRTAATLQPQVQGHITQIAVEPGAVVEKGQVLMRIDPGPQPQQLSQAVSARNARASQLALAETNLKRVQDLVARGALARQELDNAQSAAEAARADVAALAAQIAGSQITLGHYQIVAPEHGVVGDIPVRVGDLVTPQTQLTTVTDNSVLEANISIPTERAHEVATGTQIDVVDDSGKTVASGKADFVSAQVNPETQSVLVKADIANPSNLLRAGQIARARVIWRTGTGVRIPALAVTRIGAQAFVYVVDKTGGRAIARQRPVQLGDLVDNTYVVTKGLAPGDELITTGIQKLRDGAPVQPAASTPQARS